jgi:hypothetical protein
MNQIMPYSLWLGHAGDSNHFRQVFDAGIKAVVDLAVEDTPLQPPRELIYLRFPLLDGAGNEPELLGLTLRSLAVLLRMRMPTLLCCGVGLSRTPAVAAAVLSLVTNEEPDACLRRVVEYHHSDVSPGLWHDLLGILPMIRG